ncbi:MAG: hypothetical protein ACK56F_10205, partial [bacterium]
MATWCLPGPLGDLAQPRPVCVFPHAGGMRFFVTAGRRSSGRPPATCGELARRVAKLGRAHPGSWGLKPG